MSKGLGEQLTYSGSSLDARETIILQEGQTVDGVITNISNAYPGLKVKVIERLEKSDLTGELTSSKIYEIKKTSNRNKPLPASQGGYELIKEPRDLKYSDGTSFLNENGNINSDTKLIEISDKIDKLPSGMYYGQYSSVENLPAISTLNQKGYAYVSSIEPNVYYIYLYNGDGEEWQDSGNKFVTTELETNLSTKSQTKAPTTKAVKEGIESVDVTLARSAEDKNELTKAQKYNASANINDRAADVVPVTNEVKALGYKVLNSSLSFAEQIENVVESDVIVVDNSNIIFEVRDKFDLDEGTVVIPSGCVLRFNGGMVANGTLDFGNCIIDSPLVKVFDNVTITNASTSQHIHVKWFGMSSTSTNNSAIFSMVVNAFKNVIIDDGNYPMESGVTISGGSGTGIKTIIGFESKYPYRPSLNFGTLNGVALTLARNCVIQGIHLSGTKGTWDSTQVKYTNGTIGVLMQVSSVIENCGFSGCMVGISFAGYNTVQAFVNRCLFESCGNYGIYQYSYATITPLTTNATHITNNYFVNIGYNAGSSSAALAEPTTRTTSGIGMYIKAGAGNSYTGNVFEYCSGCGCLIDTPTVTGTGSERRESIYKGLVFTNNYFECNKYANLLILMNQTTDFYINDIFIAGNNFSDAGKTLPADALKWRRIALFSTFYSNIIHDHQIYIQGLETLRANFIKDGVIDIKYLTYSPILPTSVVTYSSTNPEISIAKGKQQQMDFRVPLEQGFYKLYFNIKSFILNKVVFSINYNISDASGTSVETGTISASFTSQTTSTTYANRDILACCSARSNKYFYIPQGGYFRFNAFYIGSNTNTADNNGVCINKIKFVKIESGNSTLRESFAGTIPTNYPYYDTTLKKKLLYNGSKWVDDDGFTAAKSSGATRPTLDSTDAGYRYYDTTLGKPIYWNGLSWIDGDGNYIFDNSGSLQNRLALISPIKGQQFKLTREGETDVYLIYGDYGWLNATDRSHWFDDTGTLNAMYDKYNYVLLTEEPSTWATTYNTYYKIVDGVYTKLTALETWALDTYYVKDVNVNKGIQVKLTDTDADANGSLTNRIVKWNGTKYINVVNNVALKASTPTLAFVEVEEEIDGEQVSVTQATITSTSSGKIYYTKNGDAPTSSSTEYSSAITLVDGDQVKAICIRDHMDDSGICYIPVSTPVITFNAGILHIECGTPDAKIYYTTDGNPPSTSSTVYDSSASVTIAMGITVKAFATLIGRVNSEVATQKRS